MGVAGEGDRVGDRAGVSWRVTGESDRAVGTGGVPKEGDRGR